MGLLTRALTGHMRIRSAGNGTMRAEVARLVAEYAIPGCEHQLQACPLPGGSIGATCIICKARFDGEGNEIGYA
jgi:hypothetical protein